MPSKPLTTPNINEPIGIVLCQLNKGADVSNGICVNLAAFHLRSSVLKRFFRNVSINKATYRKSSALSTFSYSLSLALLLIILSFWLASGVRLISFQALVLFYLAVIVLAAVLFRLTFTRRYRLFSQRQDIEGEINLLNAEIIRQTAVKKSLEEKIARYARLKEVIEEINQQPTLEETAETLLGVVFSLIASGKGNALLYLVDEESRRLSLFKSKNEEPGLVIKAKEGDLFDHWVLRHVRSLLVEDASSDFRFDPANLAGQEARKVASLISAPLIVSQAFLGILRLDAGSSGAYSQEDLRFLAAIAEIGAVALENSTFLQHNRELAIHDGLTSLYTKGYFLERLKEEYKRSLRHRTNFSLLMLDIDRFKEYNDRFGHTAGDIVLRELSKVLLRELKDIKALVCRFGGEEFCVFLPQVNREDARVVAEDLRLSIERKKLLLRRQETGVTVSIGLASFPADSGDEEELLFKADQALYQAKNSGRNQVQEC